MLKQFNSRVASNFQTFLAEPPILAGKKEDKIKILILNVLSSSSIVEKPGMVSHCADTYAYLDSQMISRNLLKIFDCYDSLVGGRG